MNPQPGQNIEVKARYPDLDRARDICRRIDASFEGVLNQVDTYFKSETGRLKLRQINADRAELIAYDRPNDSQARSSRYTIERVPDANERLKQLAKDHTITCTVTKRRELYLWHNVRIHLDAVDNLGDFIEFEGVVGSDADEALSRQRVRRLVTEFAIAPADQIGVSYSDLLMSADRTERTAPR